MTRYANCTLYASNVATDILQDTFQSTLEYYGHSTEAHIALSRVLFRAWHFKDGIWILDHFIT